MNICTYKYTYIYTLMYLINNRIISPKEHKTETDINRETFS